MVGLPAPFGDTLAVDDLSFGVKPGKITGFLGPNGAGNTTIRVLAHTGRGQYPYRGMRWRRERTILFRSVPASAGTPSGPGRRVNAATRGLTERIGLGSGPF